MLKNGSKLLFCFRYTATVNCIFNFYCINLDPFINVINLRFAYFPDRIPARVVLYFLSWSGFLVSFMMRNDINFALVVMVKEAADLPQNVSSIINQNASLSNITSTTPVTIRLTSVSMILISVLTIFNCI